ncbi:twin-arginine translocase subunit TatC [Thiorhodospira sibirica]|uniref:twin-arginine translocase subunit TatC n=1 Tax=Thiorhodospira sibirica TaxID=154347 RepID=UPI00022C33BB|nr:twin-arginine translocase subunit TatC [Thiorhodospira sibirica]
MPPEKDPQANATEGEGTLLSHLLELRTRLLRMVLGVLVIFIALAPFANPIYSFVAEPLMAHLPEGNSMIAIDVAAPFLIPFKLVLMLSIILAIPYLLYQVWAFVAPGLYQHERSIALPLIASSTLLFYVGMAFAYFVVFPLIFAFFTSTAPEGVAVMTDIGRYLDFIILLFLAFGIAFEVPIATILLVWMGLTTPQKLAAKRPYVIVGAFVIGMLLTPPDIISQTLLALPVWVLFEIGLLLSRVMIKRRPDEAEAAEDPDDEPPPSGPGTGAGFGRTTHSENPAPDINTQGWDQMAEHNTAQASKRFEYTPLSPEAMDAELDRIEREEQAKEKSPARDATSRQD